METYRLSERGQLSQQTQQGRDYILGAPGVRSRSQKGCMHLKQEAEACRETVSAEKSGSTR